MKKFRNWFKGMLKMYARNNPVNLEEGKVYEVKATVIIEEGHTWKCSKLNFKELK